MAEPGIETTGQPACSIFCDDRVRSITAKNVDVNVRLLPAKAGPRDDYRAMLDESDSAVAARLAVVDFITKLGDHGVPQH